MAFNELEVRNKESNPLSEGTELLTDIRLLIESHNSTEVPAAELLSYLVMKQDSEWFQHNRGKPITQKWLSRMLKGYVSTRSVEDTLTSMKWVSYRRHLRGTCPNI